MADGPLDGLRVIDLTWMLAGPYTTMLLADLGADVIKVEPPGGDPMRAVGPFASDDELHAYGGYFQSVNRNKRSVVIDLKQERGVSQLLDLVAGADVLVENFRAGVMERLGVGYERLSGHNPRLVYACIRGFGDPRTGASPHVDRPAVDVTIQAMAGLMGITGPGPGQPLKAGPGVGDLFPAALCAVGLLAACLEATRSGRGQFVDVAMYDGLLSLCERIVYQHSYTGEVPGPQGNSHPLFCPFDIFPCADGHVAICASDDRQWRALCDAMGDPAIADDARYRDEQARRIHAPEVREIVSHWTAGLSGRSVCDLVGDTIPAGAVAGIDGIVADGHAHAREMLVEVEQPGSARPGRNRRPANQADENSRRSPPTGAAAGRAQHRTAWGGGVVRLRRSELSTPGSSERMIAKAAAGAADLVFLDLEDAVAEALKPAARGIVATALRELDWGRKTRAVRINAPGSDSAEADLIEVVPAAGDALDVVIVPKVRSVDDVRWVDHRLTDLERATARRRPIGLELLIEEVEALVAVEALAQSSPRIEALIFGSGDMAASQGVRAGRLTAFPGDPWSYHRSRIVVAARAAGVAAVDGPYWGAIADIEGYRAECELVATLGFTGKWAIHPGQIEPANSTFAPTAEEIAHARRVIDAYEEAAAQGRGAIALDGTMVDAVDVRLARILLSDADSIQ